MNTYDADNRITQLTNICDTCGFVLGSYAYTYDSRGFIVAEHTEEARETDPNGRQPYIPYEPEETNCGCIHGRDCAHTYRLYVADKTYTYDDAGKLLFAAETEEGCGTTSWRYGYDLMGNRIWEEKKDPGGNVVESNRYVYNESNQLAEALLCDGRKTTGVCYTYDEDGNLTSEYSNTDNSRRTYQYTAENRLHAVYEGNTLLMAAVCDGDGSRVYQLNYNPDKDEDFTAYYCSYQNCDYDGTGIQLRADGEVSSAEQELLALVGSTLISKYELIEYVNDVNREYTQVLAEQNINGRTDMVYTYGAGRISSEMWNQEDRTGYYLYDPRGSVAGITDTEGQVTKAYQYSASGEIIYGAPEYENVYAYNGESYNPNIRSQYLRARYYNVATAAFLTEDSYLGEVMRPLTLNRYGYCLGNPVNYVDPSGESVKDAMEAQLRVETSAILDSLTQLNGYNRRANLYTKLAQAEHPNAVSENMMRYIFETGQDLSILSGGMTAAIDFGVSNATRDAVNEAIKNSKVEYIDGERINKQNALVHVSIEYLEWVKIAENVKLYPYISTADNETARDKKTVTIGIGLTFNKDGAHWAVLKNVLGWTDEEILDIINRTYDKSDESKETNIITKEQAEALFWEVEQEYVKMVNDAINNYAKTEEGEKSDLLYSQRELEAMFDCAFNQGIAESDVKNPDKIIYYYLRKDLEGAVKAVEKYNSDNRRRLNQVNLFFFDYDFLDKAGNMLDPLREKLGIRIK